MNLIIKRFIPNNFLLNTTAIISATIGLFIIISIVIYYSSSNKFKNIYPGYVEGEFVQISSEISGILQNVAITKGELVQKQQLLFTLSNNDELYAVQQAQAVIKQKQANLDDLLKGKRSDEIDVLIAEREQIHVILDLSELRLKRYKNLLKGGAITHEQFDETQSSYENNKAKLIEIDAQIRLANLGARSDAIQAAVADLDNATVNLNKANWQLSKKTILSSNSAYVHDILYRSGELVSVGSCVVMLLPIDNLKARFFINEKNLSRIKVGQSVTLSCDYCKEKVVADISYISYEAAYTPPMIFSKGSREKLVFLVEAKIPPQYFNALHPGQPLDIFVEYL